MNVMTRDEEDRIEFAFGLLKGDFQPRHVGELGRKELGITRDDPTPAEVLSAARKIVRDFLDSLDIPEDRT